MPASAATTLPSGATLTLNANGTYLYKPNGAFESLDLDESTTDTFTYTISDGQGGTSTATATITIDGRNDAPQAGVLPARASNDGATINLDVGALFGDIDVEPLTFTISNLPAGLTYDPATGTISGQITNGSSQLGEFSVPGGSKYLVQVAASDGDSEITRTFFFTIVNLPPVAVDDAATASEDGPSVAGNVLSDASTGDADTAPDADPLSVLSAAQGATAFTLGVPFTVSGGGTLTLNPDGGYTFDPGTAYNGLDAGETATETIAYTIADGNGGFDTALLVITKNDGGRIGS